MLCATKMVGDFNQLNAVKETHVTILVIVQIKIIEELPSKIGNAESIFWCKDVLEIGIVSEG